MKITGMKRHNSLRMSGYNYDEPGIYFITIATKPRRNLFWNEAINSIGQPEPLSQIGKNVRETISSVQDLDKNVEVLNFIIMPDHIHLLVKTESINTPIAEVVRWIKSRSSRLIRKNQPDLPIWQRSYYDHIVRNEREIELCNAYIEENPNKWVIGTEEEYPF